MDYKQWGSQLAEGGIEGVQKLIGTFFSKDGASERQKILDQLKAEVAPH